MKNAGIILALAVSLGLAALIWHAVEETTPASAPPPRKPPVLVSERSLPFRAVDAFLAQYDFPPAREIPLDEAWELRRGGRLTHQGDMLTIEPNQSPATLLRPVYADLNLYTAIEITMRCSAGAYTCAAWRGGVEPAIPEMLRVGASLSETPGDFVTYRMPLQTQEENLPVRGPMHTLILMPSNVPARVDIRRIRLLPRSGQEPVRVELSGETHAVLPVSDILWDFAVPDHGVLRVSMGMAKRAAELDSDGVRFKAVLLEENGETILIDHQLDPAVNPVGNWLTKEVDLSDFAGQKVRVAFTAGAGTTLAGDYAWWGNPIVFSRIPHPDSTPVFLISCDTVRPDHLGCYGYTRPTSPHLDALAADGVVFENAYCNAAWTLPSHASLLTGLYPKHHGVTKSINLSESVVTLPEILQGAGYHTAGFAGHRWWLLGSRGFADGFDVYDTSEDVYRNVFDTHTLARKWMAAHSKQPFFLFLHNYDAHSKFEGTLPYRPEQDRFRLFTSDLGPPPAFKRQSFSNPSPTKLLLAHNQGKLDITARETEYMIALYDESIREIDHAIGDFFQTLKDKGLYDRALIVVVSDHGEAFGEHGWYLHQDVYENNARVLFLIKFPGQRFAGSRPEALVQLTDVFPTICGALEIEAPPDVDGSNLVPLLESGSPVTRDLFCENASWQAVRKGDNKLVRQMSKNQEWLFNLLRDPHETQPLGAEASDLAHVLRREMQAFFTPDEGGWHLAFHGVGGHWAPVFRIASGAGIANLHHLSGHMHETTGGGRDSHQLTGKALVNPASPTTELAFTMASPSAEAFLEIEAAETPFRVQTPGALSGPKHKTRIPLDLKTLAAETAPALPAEQTHPVVSIWYEQEPPRGEKADELSPEAVEQLRALGYVE